MATLKIPENYQVVMPYLIVNDAAKFIVFMQNVFDARETLKEMRDENTIMHAEVMVGGSTIMLADSTDQYGVRNAGMFIYVPDADAAYKKALANGATPVREVADQGYGRSGGVRDPFGNTWWITTPKS
ncbi:MAG TPA: VOC family protein [Chitinophagaceae bacterium]|nr:VOC family protein [Chitinophagaceae bacterium]